MGLLPWQISPWNPGSHAQVPVEKLQVPWFEQSSGPKHLIPIMFDVLFLLTSVHLLAKKITLTHISLKSWITNTSSIWEITGTLTWACTITGTLDYWMVFYLEPSISYTQIRLKMNQDLIAWWDKAGRSWMTTIFSQHGWCTWTTIIDSQGISAEKIGIRLFSCIRQLGIGTYPQ